MLIGFGFFCLSMVLELVLVGLGVFNSGVGIVLGVFLFVGYLFAN